MESGVLLDSRTHGSPDFAALHPGYMLHFDSAEHIVMDDRLQKLLQRPDIWRGEEFNPELLPCHATGFAELDRHLPGGGWPSGALTEVLLPAQGIGELRLLMPALAQLSQQGRWLAWISPPYIPYAPALQAWGIDLSRVLLIHPRAAQDSLWAMEQALRAGTCGAVLAWPSKHDPRQQRRLQLAAETGQCWGVMFHGAHVANDHSYAALRLQLNAAPENKIAVRILKRRNGRPVAPFVVGFCN